MSSFISQNLTEVEAVTGSTIASIWQIVFCMFSCLQINCQPFYLCQLLKFHRSDKLIKIYLQTEGQCTHHKMVSLQPIPGFSLCSSAIYGNPTEIPIMRRNYFLVLIEVTKY